MSTKLSKRSRNSNTGMPAVERKQQILIKCMEATGEFSKRHDGLRDIYAKVGVRVDKNMYEGVEWVYSNGYGDPLNSEAIQQLYESLYQEFVLGTEMGISLLRDYNLLGEDVEGKVLAGGGGGGKRGKEENHASTEPSAASDAKAASVAKAEKKIWICDMCGKDGFTYEEALAHEQTCDGTKKGKGTKGKKNHDGHDGKEGAKEDVEMEEVEEVNEGKEKEGVSKLDIPKSVPDGLGIQWAERTDLLAKHLGIAKGKVDAYVKKHGLEDDGKAIKGAWEYFTKHSSLDDANLAEALQKNEVDTLKALEEEAEKEAKKVKEAYLEYLKKLFFVMKME